MSGGHPNILGGLVCLVFAAGFLAVHYVVTPRNHADALTAGAALFFFGGFLLHMAMLICNAILGNTR